MMILPHDGGPSDAPGSQRCESGSDEAAEQCVGGRGRHAQEPGEQVPEDAADEAGENDHEEGFAVGAYGEVVGVEVHDTLGHGCGHVDRQECTDEVESCGDCNCGEGLQRTGGDGGCHCVGGVVETVGEVKGEGSDDHNCQDGQCRCHNRDPFQDSVEGFETG